jgi:hypothetical protein
MPLLYGEGSNAFIRLQEVIIRSSSDQSIFAHTYGNHSKSGVPPASLLALNPAAFAGSGNAEKQFIPHDDDSYEFTGSGLRVTIPLFPVSRRTETVELPFKSTQCSHLGILNCHDQGRLVALPLLQPQQQSRFTVCMARYDRQSSAVFNIVSYSCARGKDGL